MPEAIEDSYDVVVLGAGNAGQAAAGTARKAGRSVAIVEDRDVGGTCPNRGCVPKKVLVAAAEALDEIQRASGHRIRVEGSALDWGGLIEREQSLISGLPQAMEKSLAERGIDLVRGRARFVGRHAVEVDGRRLRGRKLVVATGSKPRRLPIPGAERLMVSEQFLRMNDLPASMVFVGAGVIAMEFAHVLARAGTKVTMLELAERPLPAFDTDLVDALTEHSRAIGIDIRTGVEVEEVTAGDDGTVEVRFEEDGKSRSVSAERGFNGTGRVPDLDTLELDAAEIELDGLRVDLDEHLRSTSNPDVLFAGDVVHGKPQLSPLATYEGRIAGHNLLEPGSLRTPDYRTAPAAVFTIPAMATVGLTEAQARERGYDAETKISRPHEWLTGRTYAEPASFAKIVRDRQTDELLGAHLFGHRAEESIHLFAFAMRYGLSANELASQVYVYPTFANDVKALV